MERVQMEDLAGSIMGILEQYRDEVVTATKESVDEVAKEANEEVKRHVTFGGSGKYIKSFALQAREGRYNKGKTWHVKAPYYRLTHLLEKGHETRSGGRARAFPHIKYGEEYARENLPKRIREKLQ